MCDTKKSQKYDKQDEFWNSIIQKYETRNADLEDEQTSLRQRVDQMDAAMPAVMAFNMAKLANIKPDTDVKSLVSSACKCPPQIPHKKLKIPDLSNISVFSIEDQDVSYMNRIKVLSEQEKTLIDDVNRLRGKEKALRDAQNNVDSMLNMPARQEAAVDGNKLQDMNQCLLNENRRLNDDIADLKLELKHNKEHVEGPVCRELERERRKALMLEAELKAMSQNNKGACETAKKEIGFLRSQLEGCDKNLYDMMDINDKLKQEISVLCHRVQELQRDLINQKISEAKTLAALKSDMDDGGGGGGAFCKKGGGGSGGRGGGGGGGSLYNIARELSHDLAQFKKDCSVPDEVKQTAKGIKELCDIIDRKGGSNVRCVCQDNSNDLTNSKNIQAALNAMPEKDDDYDDEETNIHTFDDVQCFCSKTNASQKSSKRSVCISTSGNRSTSKTEICGCDQSTSVSRSTSKRSSSSVVHVGAHESCMCNITDSGKLGSAVSAKHSSKSSSKRTSIRDGGSKRSSVTIQTPCDADMQTSDSKRSNINRSIGRSDSYKSGSNEKIDCACGASIISSKRNSSSSVKCECNNVDVQTSCSKRSNRSISRSDSCISGANETVDCACGASVVSSKRSSSSNARRIDKYGDADVQTSACNLRSVSCHCSTTTCRKRGGPPNESCTCCKCGKLVSGSKGSYTSSSNRSLDGSGKCVCTVNVCKLRDFDDSKGGICSKTSICNKGSRVAICDKTMNAIFITSSASKESGGSSQTCVCEDAGPSGDIKISCAEKTSSSFRNAVDVMDTILCNCESADKCVSEDEIPVKDTASCCEPGGPDEVGSCKPGEGSVTLSASCGDIEKIDSEYVEQLEVVTELEQEPEVQVSRTSRDGSNVTTTITRSGCLEVITEGPAGIIDTTMTVTDSGNIDVVTEFIENEPTDDGKIGDEIGDEGDQLGSIGKEEEMPEDQLTTDIEFEEDEEDEEAEKPTGSMVTNVDEESLEDRSAFDEEPELAGDSVPDEIIDALPPEEESAIEADDGGDTCCQDIDEEPVGEEATPDVEEEIEEEAVGEEATPAEDVGEEIEEEAVGEEAAPEEDAEEAIEEAPAEEETAEPEEVLPPEDETPFACCEELEDDTKPECCIEDIDEPETKPECCPEEPDTGGGEGLADEGPTEAIPEDETMPEVEPEPCCEDDGKGEGEGEGEGDGEGEGEGDGGGEGEGEGDGEGGGEGEPEAAVEATPVESIKEEEPESEPEEVTIDIGPDDEVVGLEIVVEEPEQPEEIKEEEPSIPEAKSPSINTEDIMKEVADAIRNTSEMVQNALDDATRSMKASLESAQQSMLATIEQVMEATAPPSIISEPEPDGGSISTLGAESKSKEPSTMEVSMASEDKAEMSSLGTNKSDGMASEASEATTPQVAASIVDTISTISPLPLEKEETPSVVETESVTSDDRYKTAGDEESLIICECEPEVCTDDTCPEDENESGLDGMSYEGGDVKPASEKEGSESAVDYCECGPEKDMLPPCDCEEHGRDCACIDCITGDYTRSTSEHLISCVCEECAFLKFGTSGICDESCKDEICLPGGESDEVCDIKGDICDDANLIDGDFTICECVRESTDDVSDGIDKPGIIDQHPTAPTSICFNVATRVASLLRELSGLVKTKGSLDSAVGVDSAEPGMKTPTGSFTSIDNLLVPLGKDKATDNSDDKRSKDALINEKGTGKPSFTGVQPKVPYEDIGVGTKPLDKSSYHGLEPKVPCGGDVGVGTKPSNKSSSYHGSEGTLTSDYSDTSSGMQTDSGRSIKKSFTDFADGKSKQPANLDTDSSCSCEDDDTCRILHDSKKTKPSSQHKRQRKSRESETSSSDRHKTFKKMPKSSNFSSICNKCKKSMKLPISSSKSDCVCIDNDDSQITKRSMDTKIGDDSNRTIPPIKSSEVTCICINSAKSSLSRTIPLVKSSEVTCVCINKSKTSLSRTIPPSDSSEVTCVCANESKKSSSKKTASSYSSEVPCDCAESKKSSSKKTPSSYSSEVPCDCAESKKSSSKKTPSSYSSEVPCDCASESKKSSNRTIPSNDSSEVTCVCANESKKSSSKKTPSSFSSEITCIHANESKKSSNRTKPRSSDVPCVCANESKKSSKRTTSRSDSSETCVCTKESKQSSNRATMRSDSSDVTCICTNESKRSSSRTTRSDSSEVTCICSKDSKRTTPHSDSSEVTCICSNKSKKSLSQTTPGSDSSEVTCICSNKSKKSLSQRTPGSDSSEVTCICSTKSKKSLSRTLTHSDSSEVTCICSNVLSNDVTTSGTTCSVCMKAKFRKTKNRSDSLESDSNVTNSSDGSSVICPKEKQLNLKKEQKKYSASPRTCGVFPIPCMKEKVDQKDSCKSVAEPCPCDHPKIPCKCSPTGAVKSSDPCNPTVQSEYRKDVEELQKLVDKIKNACNEAENLSSVPCETNYDNTLSELQMALNKYELADQSKDVLIAGLRKQLNRPQNKLVSKFSDKENVNRVSKSSIFKSSGMQLTCIRENEETCIDDNDDIYNCAISPAPLAVIDLRRIGPTSLLVKWTPSDNRSIIGYEVYVNGCIKSRVFSPTRISTIVDDVEVRRTLNVSIYAIAIQGRCQPPAVGVYQS